MSRRIWGCRSGSITSQGMERVAVPLPKAMVPLHVTSAASWALQLLKHCQEDNHVLLRVGELGCEQRAWLGKVRWADEEMKFRIYW